VKNGYVRDLMWLKAMFGFRLSCFPSQANGNHQNSSTQET